MNKLDPYREEILNAVGRGVSQRKLARTYNVARSTVQEFIRTIHDVDQSREGQVTREELLELELKQLKQQSRKARTADVQVEAVLEEVRAALQSPPPKFTPAKYKGNGKRHHVQALLLSDLHAGEVVRPEAVDGMNEFNWDVLEQRMGRIHNSLLSYQENRPYPIDELQIWMLGDMCSGSNHLELIETNEFTAAEQGFMVGQLLGQFVEGLVPHYPKIVVYGVAGNHPRVHAKPANKNIFNNFDWMAYKIAEVQLRNYESVECNFLLSGTVVAEIAGLNVLLFHGDGIRSSMPGVPWGGVTRRVSELRKQYGERGVQLDGFALGHFHNANAVAGNIWMNGSVKGVDEYSLKQFGAGQKPTQLLLTFDAEKHRPTDVSYITP